MKNKLEVVYPDPEADYHGHPNYMKVFIWLLIYFAVSLVVSFIFSPVIAITTIFLLAVVKTSLVVRNFMHLKFEPWQIWLTVAVVLFTLVTLFFGVYPDITAVTLDVVK